MGAALGHAAPERLGVGTKRQDRERHAELCRQVPKGVPVRPLQERCIDYHRIPGLNDARGLLRQMLIGALGDVRGIQVARTAAGAPGVRAVSALRQDGALVAGDKEVVNGVQGSQLRFEWKDGSDAVLSTLGANGAVVAGK